MIPILYKKGASNYENNGVGHLKDAISCKVTEERHGDYLLTLQYPISGAWYSEIVEGAVVKAKANETSELQLFRIYKSSKPMKGVVTFYGEHISYDLKGLPLCALSMRSTTPGAALTAGFSASVLSHGFTAWSDISTLNNINITKPRSLRNFCGGEAGSVLSVWGGEFEFDNFVVKLHKHRGANNGVVINYGKNLTDAKQERNISDCYTHFCPYAIKKTETRNAAGEVTETSEETITLSDGVIELVTPENIGHTKAYTLDISDKFADGEEMNEANLRAHAEEYIASHKLGVPKVNITLSFMQIWDSPEYSKIAVHERVALCDTVTVRFSDLGIDAEAKVIKTEYDSLEERFSKIEVGDAKSTLADTVTSIEESIADTKKSLTESENAASVTLQNAIIEAANKITGNSGGYVVLSPANNPQEILIMNTPDKETATRVWRWNSSGLGYSESGYNGKYVLAMTMDGAINADFIAVGTLNAINITGCTITGGSLNINDRFTVDTEGNVHTEGYIIATGGIIGGCRIEAGKLIIPSTNIDGKFTASQINADGISASNVSLTGEINATSGTFSRWTIDKTGITGIAYLHDDVTSKRINVGLCPGNIGNIYYYAHPETNETISLFIGVTSIKEPSSDNGRVDANFMVDWKGNTYINNLTETTAAQTTSDATKKKSVSDLSEAYSIVFDKLRPVIFKYIYGTSNRYHIGLIAQEVEQAVISSGLTTNEFGAVCYQIDQSGKKINYGIRYNELLPLAIYEIQKLKKAFSELESLIKTQ